MTRRSRFLPTTHLGYLGGTITDKTKPLPGRGLGYGYDDAGNRKQVTVAGETPKSYTDGGTFAGGNSLNQTVYRQTTATRFSGTAESAAVVRVDDAVTAQRQGRYWDVALANAEEYRTIPISASINGNSRGRNATVSFPPSTETFQYDADGNLTDDAKWHYTWDAENRLIEMVNTHAQVWGEPSRTLSFQYDYLGRRVSKQDSQGGHWKYLYNGWNLVAEINAATGAIERSYGWGLDVAGRLTATGSPGALVLEAVHTAADIAGYHVSYDGSGNVAALVRGNGSKAGTFGAIYEYDPFGQLLRKTGQEAALNPFRYSTRFWDQETSLIYFGYRYYSPSLGRFINRDPIGEAGGANLYAFLENSPVNSWDRLGLQPEARYAEGEQVTVSFTGRDGQRYSYTYNHGQSGSFIAGDGALIRYDRGGSSISYDGYEDSRDPERQWYFQNDVLSGAVPLTQEIVEHDPQLLSRHSANQVAERIVYVAQKGVEWTPILSSVFSGAKLVTGRDPLTGASVSRVEASIDLAADLAAAKLAKSLGMALGAALKTAVKTAHLEKFANTKIFFFADRSWFENNAGYRKLKAAIQKNGLDDKIIDYTEIDGRKYVLTGNGRLSVAEELKITDQLQFRKVELPFKGYKTPADVLEEANNIIYNTPRG